MIYDCHLHTEFSGDCDVPVRIQIEKAISLGMKEICITDHFDHGSWFCEENYELDIPAYISALKELQHKYQNQIRINIGVELGLMNREEKFLKQFAEQNGDDFDYIIGSSHFLGNCDPYGDAYWGSVNEEETFEAYFDASLKRVRRLHDTFDAYGHLDYIVRYAPNKNKNYSYEKYAHLIDPLLQVLVDNGKYLECNTGGYKYGLEEPNPCRPILSRYRELGGEAVTVGSDAHGPAHVGIGFERCRELLLDCGFRYYAVFHGRKAEMVKL